MRWQREILFNDTLLDTYKDEVYRKKHAYINIYE